MTSTNISQGFSADKPSSKVLAPPGGRSNIFFGGDESNDQPQRKQGKPISNVFPADDGEAQKEASQNKARAQASSQSRLFGEPDAEQKTTGKAKDTQDKEEEENKEGEEGNNNEKKPEEKSCAATPSPQKSRGQYYPSHKGEDWATYDHPKGEEEEEESKDTKQSKGSRNPITHEETGNQQQAPAPQGRVRQPPGGKSSGLW